MKIKEKILTLIGVITLLNFGLFSTAFAAKNSKRILTLNSPVAISPLDKVRVVEVPVQNVLVKDYGNELLYSLAAIENDLQNNNIKAVHAKYDEILDYLIYYRAEALKHKEQNVQLANNYKGERVLEFKYGNWLSPKKLLLPLNPRGKALSFNSLRERITLSAYFKKDEIDSVNVAYVSYNTESEVFRLDMHRLLAAIEESNISYIRECIEKIYDDVLVRHEEKVSLVPKIRDNLIMVKYLADNNQFIAAKNVIDATDILVYDLIDGTSNSPIEQQKIKDLYKQLDDVARVTDWNYLLEWERIPEGVENFWKNK